MTVFYFFVSFKSTNLKRQGFIPFLIAALTAWVVAIYLAIPAWRLVTEGVKISGKVVDWRVESDADGSLASPIIEYLSPETGKTERLETSFDAPLTKTGDTIELFYLKGFDKKPRPNKFLELWLWPSFLGFLPWSLVLVACAPYRGKSCVMIKK